MATPTADITKYIDLLATSIASLRPIPNSELTSELHLAMIDMFDALDLKPEVEQKLLQKVKEKGQGKLGDIKSILPSELPENLPRIRGPANYFLVTLIDGRTQHVVVTTSGPYVILGDQLAPKETTKEVPKESTIQAPTLETNKVATVNLNQSIPQVSSAPGQEPISAKIEAGQQQGPPILNTSPKDATPQPSTNITNNPA